MDKMTNQHENDEPNNVSWKLIIQISLIGIAIVLVIALSSTFSPLCPGVLIGLGIIGILIWRNNRKPEKPQAQNTYHIQSLVKMLQSDNHNTRYDACEQLRMLPSLPLEALDALRSTINDDNLGVADAARRAIEHHSQIERLQLEQYQAQKWKPNLFLFGFLFFVMSACGYFVFIFGGATAFTVPDSYAPLLNISGFSLLLFPVGAIIVLTAAYIMHQKNYHAKANALIYILIAVYLINFLIHLIVLSI
jgi:hypothetical protein